MGSRRVSLKKAESLLKLPMPCVLCEWKMGLEHKIKDPFVHYPGLSECAWLTNSKRI